jgi:hypothetical protein
MLAHVGQLGTALDGLERLARARNPVETEAAHLKRVAEAATKLGGRVSALENRLAELNQEGAIQLSEAMERKAGLVPDEFAGEIRAAVRGMSGKERTAVLQQAVDNGEAALVAALTSGHSVLTGFNPEYRDRMRQAFIEKHAPNEYNALNTLHDTYSGSVKALGVARRAVTQSFSPEKIAQISEQQKAASEAQSGFESAEGGPPARARLPFQVSRLTCAGGPGRV